MRLLAKGFERSWGVLNIKWEAPLSGPGGAWDIRETAVPCFRLQELVIRAQSGLRWKKGEPEEQGAVVGQQGTSD